MSSRFSRKGWCPGALKPMATGDGLLARVRPSAGRLTLDQAEALAKAAEALGNGVLEISSRANLQLRGLTGTSLPGLWRLLATLGLLDPDAACEAVRNIVASPLSDLDDQAAFDVLPIVRALEARMQVDDALRALPGKFGFVIDAGGRFKLAEVEADLRFEAQGEAIAVRLGGDNLSFALCSLGDVADVAARLAQAFVDFTRREGTANLRMRGLVGRIGAECILRAAKLAPQRAPSAPKRALDDEARVGVFVFAKRVALIVAPSLGRMRAVELLALIETARACAAADLRLTPWRALALTLPDPVRAEGLLAHAEALGFIADPHDPRLRVVACAGRPACASAARDVQADALALAGALRGGHGVMLHVSGCRKGCARAKPAPATLVAEAGGYDLILNGKACDPPSRRGLSVAEARRALSVPEFAL